MTDKTTDDSRYANAVDQFVRAYAPAILPARPIGHPAIGGEHDTDLLLSVVLIPGGTSTVELVDVLVALDAQSLDDFELVLVAPSPQRADCARLEELVAPFSSGLSVRSRVVPGLQRLPESRGRADAVDVGIAVARGRYVTVLDGRSIPFAHFIETFAHLAVEAPGSVLRTHAVTQPMRRMTWYGDRDGYEPIAGATPASAEHFSLLEHLAISASPPGSYALPRSFFKDLGRSYGGVLPGFADDQILFEAAMLCGVQEATEVTILLRTFGDDVPGSDPAAQLADRHLLVEYFDQSPVLLPAGSLAGLLGSELLLPGLVVPSAPDTTPQPTDLLGDTVAELEHVHSELASLRAEFAKMQASTSWRVTSPLRRLSHVVRRVVQRR